MLIGDRITLRTVREKDLDFLYDMHENISNRGDFYPVHVYSEPGFRQKFEETGFWSENNGLLLITDPDDGAVLGEVQYFETLRYLDELEIAYYLYAAEHAGKGYVTEAVQLLTDYLFQLTKFNRIRLVIHPGNEASKRIAEKSGYSFESTMRGAWYHRGEHHDPGVYVRLRND